MAIARFSLVALDCPDPEALAAFYADSPGGRSRFPTGSTSKLKAGGGLSRATRWRHAGVSTHPAFVTPTWPGGLRPQQLHLDVDVDDLDVGEAAVLQLGARKTDLQPDPAEFRVFLDPVGHPFCLVLAES